MKGQSQGGARGKGRSLDAYQCMVLCLKFGLKFSYLKNYENKVLSISLDSQKILYLDFAKWTSELERAVIYDQEVQVQVNLVEVSDAIAEVGAMDEMQITPQIKMWLDILYKADISFEYRQKQLIVKAQKENLDRDFEFVIRFSKKGEMNEAHCKLDGVMYYFYYQESPEWTFYRFLDKAGKRDDHKDDQIS